MLKLLEFIKLSSSLLDFSVKGRIRGSSHGLRANEIKKKQDQKRWKKR